jgi:multidrug transporter EmrE-like cation transporter
MVTRQSRQQATERQLRRLENRLIEKRAQSSKFTQYRLAVFFTALALSALINFTLDETLAWTVFSAGMLVFSIVAYCHFQLNRSIKKHEIWLDWKSSQLARMHLDWRLIPRTDDAPVDPEHPFALDLDIVGLRSLHRLLDIAVSKEGSERLKQWLLVLRPDPDAIFQRQALVHELIPLSHFRNNLFLTFSLASKQHLEGKKLISWLHRQEKPRVLPVLLFLLTVMAGSNILLFALHQLGVLPAYYIWTLIAYIFVFLMNHKVIETILSDSTFLDDELAKLQAILKFLETYPYQNKEALKKICEPFWQAKERPSRQISKIKRVALLVGLRGNPLLNLVLNGVCPWDFYCANLLFRSKKELAEIVPEWLDIFFELEALLALANLGYLNPEYAFPEVVNEDSGNGQIILEAKAIGHPLIPFGQKISNDFSQTEIGEMALITGSNMAGKSTFLKTLGINLCLAYAGGPVDAAELRCSLLRIFTCIKINDSVTDGFSYFYAEVRRLKKLLGELEATDHEPIFFLIDEIFKGTNNRERLIGSRAYIRSLANRHGLGAISTHDLELVHLAEEINSIKNYHFREEVVNGKMAFDYKLRPGPCPTTNALKIMQLEGLPVEDEAILQKI